MPGIQIPNVVDPVYAWVKRSNYLERKLDNGPVEIFDSCSPDHIDKDVLEVGADVVVDGGDDGVRPDDGTAQDACTLSET